MPISSVCGMQHIGAFNKDKPYWGVNREDAKCPGPHFESIWFKDFGHSILRYCIDNESKINLPSGGRARFVIINFQRENSITVGGRLIEFLNISISLELSNDTVHAFEPTSNILVEVKGNVKFGANIAISSKG